VLAMVAGARLGLSHLIEAECCSRAGTEVRPSSRLGKDEEGRTGDHCAASVLQVRMPRTV
jgi:hypothetical protein